MQATFHKRFAHVPVGFKMDEKRGVRCRTYSVRNVIRNFCIVEWSNGRWAGFWSCVTDKSNVMACGTERIRFNNSWKDCNLGTYDITSENALVPLWMVMHCLFRYCDHSLHTVVPGNIDLGQDSGCMKNVVLIFEPMELDGDIPRPNPQENNKISGGSLRWKIKHRFKETWSNLLSRRNINSTIPVLFMFFVLRFCMVKFFSYL